MFECMSVVVTTDETANGIDNDLNYEISGSLPHLIMIIKKLNLETKTANNLVNAFSSLFDLPLGYFDSMLMNMSMKEFTLDDARTSMSAYFIFGTIELKLSF